MTASFLSGIGRLSCLAAFLFGAMGVMYSSWLFVPAVPAAVFGVWAVLRVRSKRNEELGDEALAAAEEWDREHGVTGDGADPPVADRV